MKKIKTKEEIEVLRKKADKARFLYTKAQEDYQQSKVLPQLKKMIGKCFKYRNSYGGGREDWWLYAKITAIDDVGYAFTATEFQYTSLQKVEIDIVKKYNFRQETFFSRSGYIEITASEYNKAKKKMLKFVTTLLS